MLQLISRSLSSHINVAANRDFEAKNVAVFINNRFCANAHVCIIYEEAGLGNILEKVNFLDRGSQEENREDTNQ